MLILDRSDVKENVGKIIESTRNELGHSQSKMGKLLGLSQSTYFRLINGEVDNTILYAIYKFCKLNNMTLGEVVGDPSPNTDLNRMFKSLPEFRQRTIRTIIALDSQLNIHEAYDEDYVDCYVLTNDNRDGMLYDAASYEPVNVAGYRNICPYSIDCAIRITSNHLHPTIHADDILLIHQGPPRNGDTGVFINKNSKKIFFRRFIQGDICRLEPIAPYGETILVDSHNHKDMNQWIKFGFVMTRLR